MILFLSRAGRRLCLAFLAWACVPGLVLAEGNCTDRPECWPEGSAMRTGLEMLAQKRTAEANLRTRHAELVEFVASSSAEGFKVDERMVAALRAQQEAWLKYVAEECELVGALRGAGGSWGSTYATRCELNQTQQRLRRVQAALRCVRNLPAADRVMEQGKCLQPLVPLANAR